MNKVIGDSEKDIDPKPKIGLEELRKSLKVGLYTDAKKKLKMPLIKTKEHKICLLSFHLMMI